MEDSDEEDEDDDEDDDEDEEVSNMLPWLVPRWDLYQTTLMYGTRPKCHCCTSLMCDNDIRLP